MGSAEQRDGAARRLRPLEEIVPARAVLTELCRGFLLVQESDPVHARQFARSFLKERAGAPPPGPSAPPSRLPAVRRGAVTTPSELAPE